MLLIKPFPDKAQTFGDGCASKCVSQSVGGCAVASTLGPAPSLRGRPLGTGVGSTQSREANSSRDQRDSSSKTELLWRKRVDLCRDGMALSLSLCVWGEARTWGAREAVAGGGLEFPSMP